MRQKYVAVRLNNGKVYYVLKPNEYEAAKRLDEINSDLLILLRHLRKKYSIDESPTNTRIYTIVSHLLDNYNYEVLYENPYPRFGTNTAYTINKGQTMYICLRNRNGKFIDKNTLMFVILHEAAHIANYDGWGHNDVFWTIFKMLLTEAIEIGVYYRVDYRNYPVEYCGLRINYSPLYDDSLNLNILM